MRRPLIGLALSLSLLAPAFVRADEPNVEPPPSSMGPGPGQQAGGGHGELHAIFTQLGLTPDQKSQIKALRQSKMNEDKARHRSAREAKHAFAQAMSSNSSDDAIRSAHQALAHDRAAIADARIEELLAVRRILNSDQRRRFGEMYVDFKRRAAHGQEE